MTNIDLAFDYYKRAKNRYSALKHLLDLESYPDVIRESQEIIELLLKGYLRSIKIDPPKWHDVSQLFHENKLLLSKSILDSLDEITSLSVYLRRERETSFYGDDDLIPMNSYTKEEATNTYIRVGKILLLIESEFKSRGKSK